MVDASGENAIVVAPGANEKLSIGPRHIRALSRASVVLCQLEVPLQAVGSALAMAGNRAVLNAAPSRRLPSEVIDATDILVVNEVELRDLGGGVDPASARSIGVSTVVATMGEAGAQVITDADIGHVRPPRVTVYDTTGAGDAFCGAFGAALDDGLDVFESTVRGVVAGSLATTGLGARSSMPDRTSVERMLNGRS
jgi:ribokinase